MASELESDIYADQRSSSPKPSNWLKIAFITAGSALAGGLAAAWWYRKTLAKLRETGETSQNSHFGISTEQDSQGPEEDL